MLEVPVSHQSEGLHDFSVFLMLRALRYELLPSKLNYSELIRPDKNKFMEDSAKLQADAKVRSSELLDLIECQFKELSEEKYTSGWLQVRKGSIVLIEKVHQGSSQPNGMVRHCLSCKDMMCVADKSDPRKLIFSIGGQPRLNASIMLKDSKTAFSTKNRLEEAKLETLRHEFTQILQTTEKCSEDIPFVK